MKVTLSMIYLSLIFLSLIISSHESFSSLPSNSLIGIPPQDEEYFKGEMIKCKNGSKEFTKNQLNDDFCDCPDGTDEPGTSACPQGKFYCKNIGHSPNLIYSSRVNDGICDCCDGSDEYDGKVKCTDTCHEAGKVAMESLKRKIEVYREGVVLRKQEIEQAQRAITRDKAELSGLEKEREVVEKLVNQLEGQVRKLEQERQEKEDTMLEDQNEKVEDEKSGLEANFDSQLEPVKTSDVLTRESPSDQNEKSEHKSFEGLSKEELGRIVASRWTGKKSGEQVEKIDPAKNIQTSQAEGRQDDGYEESVADNAGRSSTVHYKYDSEDRENSSDIAAPSSQSWLDKIQETSQNFLRSVNLFSTPVADLDASQIRKEYNDHTAKLADIGSRISSLTEKFEYDFGKENEFYLFYDRCFELKQDRYVYKVCPFKDATQGDGSGSETRLGKWDKFGNYYSLMLFTNGAECWNGPDRSFKVKLRCGLKTELTSVDEPSRCEYEALMYTPVLCLEEKLEELKQEVESLNREQQWSHDEL